MICQNCKCYVSGDACKTCELLIKEKKPLIKKAKIEGEKRKVEKSIYKILRSKFLRENQRCAVFPELKAIEIHHSRGRHGKNYLDVKTWFAVSRAGHNWIHENDAEARARGFLLIKTN